MKFPSYSNTHPCQTVRVHRTLHYALTYQTVNINVFFAVRQSRRQSISARVGGGAREPSMGLRLRRAHQCSASPLAGTTRLRRACHKLAMCDRLLSFRLSPPRAFAPGFRPSPTVAARLPQSLDVLTCPRDAGRRRRVGVTSVGRPACPYIAAPQPCRSNRFNSAM
jgi:hypothetical protein